MSGAVPTRAVREAALLRMVTAAAERGEVCPSNLDVAEALGMSSTSDVAGLLDSLARRGLIAVERGANTRVVTILGTGLRTAGEARGERVNRGPSTTRRAGLDPASDPPLPPRGPERDPCPRCGVRADVGCGHRRIAGLLVREAPRWAVAAL